MALTTLEVLRGARELLADEAHWVRGDFARNASGASVLSTSTDACAWCLVGAMRNKAGGKTDAYFSAFSAIFRLLRNGHTRLSDFNDTHSHAEVLDLLDRAIAAEESR